MVTKPHQVASNDAVHIALNVSHPPNTTAHVNGPLHPCGLNSACEGFYSNVRDRALSDNRPTLTQAIPQWCHQR